MCRKDDLSGVVVGRGWVGDVGRGEGRGKESLMEHTLFKFNL